MTASKLYLAVYESVKSEYPKLGGDAWASAAAEIVKRGYAAIGSDGRMNYLPAVADLAPRLAPTQAINPDADERTKLAQYAALLARQSEMLPVKCATRSTTWDASKPMSEQLHRDPKSDLERAENAAILVSRYEQNASTGDE